MRQEVFCQDTSSYTVVLQALLDYNTKLQVVLQDTLEAQVGVVEVILELCVEEDRLTKSFLSEYYAKAINACNFMVSHFR